MHIINKTLLLGKINLQWYYIKMQKNWIYKDKHFTKLYLKLIEIFRDLLKLRLNFQSEAWDAFILEHTNVSDVRQKSIVDRFSRVDNIFRLKIKLYNNFSDTCKLW